MPTATADSAPMHLVVIVMLGAPILLMFVLGYFRLQKGWRR
jgi:hypothetical protein